MAWTPTNPQTPTGPSHIPAPAEAGSGAEDMQGWGYKAVCWWENQQHQNEGETHNHTAAVFRTATTTPPTYPTICLRVANCDNNDSAKAGALA